MGRRKERGRETETIERPRSRPQSQSFLLWVFGHLWGGRRGTSREYRWCLADSIPGDARRQYSQNDSLLLLASFSSFLPSSICSGSLLHWVPSSPVSGCKPPCQWVSYPLPAVAVLNSLGLALGPLCEGCPVPRAPWLQPGRASKAWETMSRWHISAGKQTGLLLGCKPREKGTPHIPSLAIPLGGFVLCPSSECCHQLFPGLE